jgi:hypothetical protein
MRCIFLLILPLFLINPILAISILPSDTDGGVFNFSSAYNFSFNVTNRFSPYTMNITFEVTTRSINLIPYVNFTPENMTLLPDEKKELNVTIAITGPGASTGQNELIFRPRILFVQNGTVVGPTGTTRINFTFKKNNPPVLISNIPDQTWKQDTSLTGLRLLDYFYDPENDTMTFEAEQPSRITITIAENSIVTFTSERGWYGVRYTLFRACDPFTCTASNIVKLTVEKITYPSGPPPSPSPPPAPSACIEHWICTDWSGCINGTDTRDCADANNCGTERSKPVMERKCEMPVIPTVTTTTTTIPPEISGEIPAPGCREGAREPWLLMSILILLAFMIETYALMTRRKTFVSWPFFVSIILIVLSMTDYLYYICLCPEDCQKIPWNSMTVAGIVVFLILLVVRIRWLYVVNRVNSLKRRLRERLIKKVPEAEETGSVQS